MPSPVGHSLSGLFVYTLVEKPARPFRQWRTFLPYVVFANLPDVDFLMFRGGHLAVSSDYHHQYSHSLGFGCLTALVVYGVLSLFREKGRGKAAVLALLLTALHCFLDLANRTGQRFSPEGLPILWPLYTHPIACSLTILPGVSVGLKPYDPVNLIGVSCEFLLFGFLIGAVMLFRSLLKKHLGRDQEKGYSKETA